MKKELTIIGSDRFSELLAESLLEFNVRSTVITRSKWITLSGLQKIKLYIKSKRILQIYSNTKLKYLITSKIFGNKVFNYWIGSDVPRDIKNRRITKIACKIYEDYFADGQMIIDELKAINIHPKFIPNPFAKINTDNIPDLPKIFTILIYLPGHRNDYNKQLMKEVIVSLPNINFEIVADNGDIFNLPNANFNGYINLPEFYKKVSCLLRIPDHDSLSTMVLEALSYDRHVIWNYNFKYCTYATNKQEIIKAIKELANQNKQNHNSQSYIIENFNSKIITKKLYSFLFK